MFVTNREMLGTEEYLIKENSLICIVITFVNCQGDNRGHTHTLICIWPMQLVSATHNSGAGAAGRRDTMVIVLVVL